MDIENLHVVTVHVQAWTAWLIVHVCLVMWSGEIARIIVCPVGLLVIRVQVSYKAHLVSVFKLYL